MSGYKQDKQRRIKDRQYRQLPALLVEVAVSLIKTPGEKLDATIRQALALIGRCIGAGSGAVFEFDRSGMVKQGRYYWGSGFAGDGRIGIPAFHVADLGLCLEPDHRDCRMISLPVADMASGELRKRCEQQSIRDLLAIPLPAMPDDPAVLVFTAVSLDREWPPPETALLQFADMLVSAVRRGKREMTMIAACEKQEQTNRQLEEAVDRGQLMALEAESADIAKSQFLASMSHEIRTPMNAISGLVHLAREKNQNARINSYLDKIKTASNTLLHTINEILDYSKIEAGRMELEKHFFSPAKVLETIAAMFSVQAQEKGLSLRYEIEPQVPERLIGDSLRLRQSLINLVGNALKFTDFGQVEIKVRVAAGESGRTTLCFGVRDSGIGIAPDKHKLLFKPFSQVDSSMKRRYGGTGLGLSITRKLVALMGGEIWFDSEPGQGSEFFFTAVFDNRINPETVISMINRQGLKILVAEQDRETRRVIAEHLDTFHFQCDFRGSGKEVILALQEAELEGGEPYDLLLLAERLPDQDGRTIAADVRQRTGLEDGPVTVILADPETTVAVKAGDDDLRIVAKPVTQSTLFDLIIDIFGCQESLFDSADPQAGAMNRRQGVPVQPPSRGGSVLIVEDNLINREIAQALLEQAGFKTTLVDNGRDALKILRNQVFDLVLMDLQMPGMDGLETTRRIRNGHFGQDAAGRNREQPSLSSVPIIAITAHAMNGDRENALEAGVDDYITKPFEPETLIGTVLRWIDNRPENSRTAAPGNEQRLSVAGSGVDFAAGLQRVNNDLTAYQRLLEQYLQDSDAAMGKLIMLAERDDVSGIRSVLHGLKGIAGNVGAGLVFSGCRGAEEAVARGEKLNPLLEQLGRDKIRVDQEITAWIRNQTTRLPPAPEAAAAGRDETIDQVLSRLLDGLENDLFIDDETIAAVNRLKPPDQSAAVHLSALVNALSELDYQTAREQCFKLRGENH